MRLDTVNKMNKRSDEIKLKKYKSDVWLEKEWQQFKDENDEFNSVAFHYIPDLINHRFKYMIECDGSFHNSPKQKRWDRNKDRFFRKNGYTTFRVKFGDIKRLKEIGYMVSNYRRYSVKPRSILIKGGSIGNRNPNK